MSLEKIVKERSLSFENPETVGQHRINKLLAELKDLEGSFDKDTVSTIIVTENKYAAEVALHMFGDVDPKTLSLQDLKFIANISRDRDSNVLKYLKRISSPVTAIRAFCVSCQGGNVHFIRDCAATNCPFWPFRHGKNAFYGKLANAEVESIDDDEDEDDGDSEES